MNILITGGTGFIGTALIQYLKKDNHSISILTRNKNKVSDTTLAAFENIDDIPSNTVFDAMINLAGAPISKRWSKAYKNKLISSRVDTTKSVYELVKKLDKKPDTIISASAIGYYGDQQDREVTESTPPHHEFTHTLCSAWENEALRLNDFNTKVVIIRLGVVLGINQGMLKETTPMFKLGLGGKLGDGSQYLSWIHIDDVVQGICFLLQPNIEGGIYNLTSPCPVTNREWTKSMAKAIGKPALLPLPSKIVTLMFGEMGKSLLLAGQRVLPEKLEKSGFQFKHPELTGALFDIFSKQ